MSWILCFLLCFLCVFVVKKVKQLVINRKIVYCHVKLGNAAELAYQKKKKKWCRSLFFLTLQKLSRKPYPVDSNRLFPPPNYTLKFVVWFLPATKARESSTGKFSIEYHPPHTPPNIRVHCYSPPSLFHKHTAPKPFTKDSSIEHQPVPNSQPFLKERQINFGPTKQVIVELIT